MRGDGRGSDLGSDESAGGIRIAGEILSPAGLPADLASVLLKGSRCPWYGFFPFLACSWAEQRDRAGHFRETGSHPVPIVPAGMGTVPQWMSSKLPHTL